MYKLLLLTVLCVWGGVSGSGVVRYDLTNFGDIVGNSLFQVMNYSSLDLVYGIPVPTEGEGSGGAFLLDGDGYGCMKFTMNNSLQFILSVSFWCDPDTSELTLDSNCGFPNIELCERRTGQWNVTKVELDCPAYLPVSTVELDI